MINKTVFLFLFLASTPGIKVYLNDKRLPVKNFEDYCKLYLNSDPDEMGNFF